VLDPAVRSLAEAKSTVTLATLMPDGRPHTTLVWAHADAEHLLIGTNKGRQKYRNVLGDPRVSVVIIDPDNWRRYVEVRGRVARIDTGRPALDLVHTTFAKWTGSPAPIQVEAERVLLRITADRIVWKD
jgi:PPOX class probable F420-dependent enzyme